MKKIGKRIIVLITIILFINLSWFLFVNIKYNKFVEVMPENNLGNHIYREDGYLYSVKKPNYLYFQGNLFISKDAMSLNIYPMIFEGYEYHFSINDKGNNYNIKLNRYLEPVSIDGKEINAQSNEINKYNREFEELLKKANEMWSL